MGVVRFVKARLFGFAWAILLLVACYLAYQALVPRALEFVELSSPKGFRALVVNGGASAFDPLQTLTWETENPNASAAQQPDEGRLCEVLLRDPASPVDGNRTGTVSVVEFFDYRCPYCKVLTKILSELRAEGRIHVIYKEWPILSEGSLLGARAALAARKQGKYLEFHERLMQSRLIPTMGQVEHLSRTFEIDQSRLMKDMFSTATNSALQRNSALASKLGLVGTPALVVGRTVVQGAVTQEQLERVIADEQSSEPAC